VEFFSNAYDKYFAPSFPILFPLENEKGNFQKKHYSEDPKQLMSNFSSMHSIDIMPLHFRFCSLYKMRLVSFRNKTHQKDPTRSMRNSFPRHKINIEHLHFRYRSLWNTDIRNGKVVIPNVTYHLYLMMLSWNSFPIHMLCIVLLQYQFHFL
jgi:hypothetical protein